MTLRTLGTNVAALNNAYAKAYGAKVQPSKNGIKYDGTDETTAFNALIASLVTFGGGTIELEGVVRCDGQVNIPATNAAISTQPPVRISGTVVHMPGSAFTGTSPYPAMPGLDLRYAGRTNAGCGTTLGSDIVTNAAATAADRGLIVTGPGIPDWTFVLAVQAGVGWTLSKPARATGTVSLTSFGGRIQGLGLGNLELDHVQLMNNGTASSAPFVLTTGARLDMHHSLVLGHSSKSSSTCDEDIWVAGGSGQGTALTAALNSGTAYTSLSVDALPVALVSGRPIYIARNGTVQIVTLSASAARGATTISVNSFTPAVTYPARTGVAFGDAQDAGVLGALDVPSAPFQGYGSEVHSNHFHRVRRIALGMWASSVNIDNNSWMHTCGSNLAKAPSTLTSALISGNTYTTLAVTALSAAANVGDVLQLGTGTTSQETVVAVAAAAGATSVTVTSFTANAAYSTSTQVFNTTAGIGAAVTHYADDSNTGQFNVKGNRFGMSGGYSCAVRLAGAAVHSLLAANDVQDQQADANYLAVYRFERGAGFNLVLPGLGVATTYTTVDDWSSAAHTPQQTVLDHNQSVLSQLTQGVNVNQRLRTSSSAFIWDDLSANQILTITGALRQWAIKAPVNIDGNSGGNGSTALQIGNNSTDSDATITLNTPTGRVGQIQFKRAGSNSWLLYDANSTTLFLRDSVNAKMHVTYTPGSGAGGGSTEFNSAVKVDGALTLPYVSKAAAYTLADTDHTVSGDATTAAFNLTLPTSSGRTGRVYILRKSDVSANAVTVATQGGQTINGAATYALTAQYQTVRVQSDGTNWMVI